MKLTTSSQEPYDAESDRVVVHGEYNECNLVIKRVNRTLDEGDWYCNLTKDVATDGGQAVSTRPALSWYEVTMYKLKVAKETKMEISGPKGKKVRKYSTSSRVKLK